MSATGWAILMLGVTALIYAFTALAYRYGARPGMALAFTGYAVANIGLIWDAVSIVVDK